MLVPFLSWCFCTQIGKLGIIAWQKVLALWVSSLLGMGVFGTCGDILATTLALVSPRGPLLWRERPDSPHESLEQSVVPSPWLFQLNSPWMCVSGSVSSNTTTVYCLFVA